MPDKCLVDSADANNRTFDDRLTDIRYLRLALKHLMANSAHCVARRRV